MKKLASKSRGQVLDVLAERLTFERAGVKLYDRVIECVRASREPAIDGDDSLRHMFHALATAELVDNAGWDLLVDLADEADDDDAKKSFKKRLHEEEEHLIFVKRALEKLTRHDVLGESVSVPTSP